MLAVCRKTVYADLGIWDLDFNLKKSVQVLSHRLTMEPIPDLHETTTDIALDTPLTGRKRKGREGSLLPKKSIKSLRPSYPSEDPAIEVERLGQAMLTKMGQGFDEILALLRQLQGNPESMAAEARKRAMEELNKEQYLKTMSHPLARQQALELFKDGEVATDFMLYPAAYRHVFLEELLAKAHKIKGK